ncbi:MAG: hypothetical protein AAB074_06095 [Planctomycetota bacterium]
MRPLAIALFLASVALAEDPAPVKSDPAAEELLKKVEEKIGKAKTVSIRASLTFMMGRFAHKFEIELDFKEGNRARIMLASRDKGTAGAACDGKVVRRKTPQGDTTADAAADFAAKGREMSLRIPMIELSAHFEGKEPQATPAYSEFAFLPDEKIGERAVRVVTFASTRDSRRKDVRVWIDEKSLEVLKREIVEKKQAAEERETLTFGSMAYDADLPDSTFESVVPKAEDKK